MVGEGEQRKPVRITTRPNRPRCYRLARAPPLLGLVGSGGTAGVPRCLQSTFCSTTGLPRPAPAASRSPEDAPSIGLVTQLGLDAGTKIRCCSRDRPPPPPSPRPSLRCRSRARPGGRRSRAPRFASTPARVSQARRISLPKREAVRRGRGGDYDGAQHVLDVLGVQLGFRPGGAPPPMVRPGHPVISTPAVGP
jgi:hypothetical protein